MLSSRKITSAVISSVPSYILLELQGNSGDPLLPSRTFAQHLQADFFLAWLVVIRISKLLEGLMASSQ